MYGYLNEANSTYHTPIECSNEDKERLWNQTYQQYYLFDREDFSPLRDIESNLKIMDDASFLMFTNVIVPLG